MSLLIGTGWIVFHFLNKGAETGLTEARQKLIDQGAPMKLEDVLSDPVADEENAAFLLESASAFDEQNDALDDAEFELEEITDYYSRPWQDYSPEQIQRLAEIYQSEPFSEYFGMLKTASRKDRFYYELRGLAPGELIGHLIPSVGDVMDFARYSSIEALIQFRNGDIDASIESISRIFSFAETIEEHGNLVVGLTSIALTGIGLDALEELSNSTNLTNQELAMMKSSLRKSHYQRRFLFLMDFERLAFGDATWSLMSEDPEALSDMSDTPSLKYVFKSPVGQYFINREMAFYYSSMAELRELLMREPLIGPGEFESEMETIAINLRESYAIMSSILLPTFASVYTNACTTDEKIQITRTALSLLQFHNDHGAYPETLDALVPEYMDAVPLDVFSGEALVYRKVDEGFQLYSLGPNQIDDGGYEDPDDPKDYDLAWKGRGAIPVEGPEAF